MKKENTATRLREIMGKRNLRQIDILNLTVPYCEKYDVKMNKSDLSQYCSGKTEPNQDKLYVLGLALGVSEAWLMGYDVPMERGNFKKAFDGGDHSKPNYSVLLYGHDEQDLILQYRKLSALGKSEALKRISELSLIPDYQALDIPQSDMLSNIIEFEPVQKTRRSTYTYYQHLASAGTGEYIFADVPTDTIEAPYMEYADFIIGVNGDSMEPTYYDGDKVYVEKRQVVEVGDIGIFMVNNECFIKEAGRDGLISHNKKYRMIPGSEHIICVGKVLGKVDEMRAYGV